MKKVVVNIVVLVWASLYLLALNVAETARNVRREFLHTFLPVVGEIQLLQCVLILCIGAFTIGFAGLFMAVMK